MKLPGRNIWSGGRRNGASDIPVPQFVKVQGASPVAEQKHRTVPALPGGKAGRHEPTRKPCSTRLTGIGRYDTAGYQITKQNGQDGLLVTMHEKLYAPPHCNWVFEVDGSESSDVDFTLATRLTFLDVAGTARNGVPTLFLATRTV